MDASDQESKADSLTKTGKKMLELRDEIFEKWERRVRERVKEASTLKRLVLIDTLPAFYVDLARSLSTDNPLDAVDTSTLATEHGGERARLTSYDIHSIISEYQILRWTILEVLKEKGVELTADEIIRVNYSIDSAIREAGNGFSLIYVATREQFIAALSHDLRGPLNTANLAAQLILRSGDVESNKELAIKIIHNNARMEQMIQNLLDTMVFQGGGRLSLSLSYFDILDLVETVYVQFASSHGNRFERSGSSVYGWWDRDALQRALENILGNAVKYSTPDTPIRIEFEADYERLQLSVHNEGNPIPAEELECIFQIFRRARAAQRGDKKGWGIGLPFVRGVAESHGGSVGVASSAERGTTFTVDIPIDCRPFRDAPVIDPVPSP